MDDDIRQLLDEPPDELFGWPVSLLDQLLDLSHRAAEGVITLEEWRVQDAELRADGSPVDPERIKAIIDRAVNALIEVDLEGENSRPGLHTLLGRLGKIVTPAPDDAALRSELRELAEFRRGRDREAFARRADVVRGWLTSSENRDPVTGLPWELLGRYRWTALSFLGPTPTFADEARRRALADAPAEVARAAQEIRNDTGLKARMSSGRLRQLTLTGGIEALLDEAQSNAEHANIGHRLEQLWQDPGMQRLLLDLTADDWPAAMKRVPFPMLLDSPPTDGDQ